MSAREAYIAGRSGGSRPSTKQTRGSDPSETQKNEQEQQREQSAYDAGQQERQREQRATITKEKGVGAEGGLTPEELQQARNIASGKGDIDTFKDPYDVLTRQQEITAGYPKTALEKLREASGVKLLNPTLQLMGIGAKALQGLLDKTFKPQVSDFSNPNFLAVLDAAFKSGRLDKEKYTEKYKDLLDDVYGDQSKDPEMQTKLLEEGIGSLDSESLFNLAMEQATEGCRIVTGKQTF